MTWRTSRTTRSLLAWAVAGAAVLAVTLVAAPDALAADETSEVDVGGVPGSDAEAIGDIALGNQLYAQNCASCHAANGRGAIVPGSDRPAPPIADAPSVTAAYVDLVMRTGRMPPAESPFDNRPRRVVYDDAQRLAIVAFTIDEFGVENDLFDVGEGNAGRGQQLWAANCAACHGSTGAGGVAGGGAWTPTIYPLDAVTIGEAIRVGPFQMPAFNDDQIDAQGVADIGAFMEEVDSEEGTPLGLTELNPVFASGFVALLAVVMLASLGFISGRPSWFPDPGATDADAGPDAPDSQVESRVSGGGVEARSTGEEDDHTS